MSLVDPFCSVVEQVYHNNDECGPGKQITKKREPGTDNRPLCEDCQKLSLGKPSLGFSFKTGKE